jgi:hypothetical protein
MAMGVNVGSCEIGSGFHTLDVVETPFPYGAVVTASFLSWSAREFAERLISILTLLGCDWAMQIASLILLPHSSSSPRIRNQKLSDVSF